MIGRGEVVISLVVPGKSRVPTKPPLPSFGEGTGDTNAFKERGVCKVDCVDVGAPDDLGLLGEGRLTNDPSVDTGRCCCPRFCGDREEETLPIPAEMIGIFVGEVSPLLLLSKSLGLG